MKEYNNIIHVIRPTYNKIKCHDTSKTLHKLTEFLDFSGPVKWNFHDRGNPGTRYVISKHTSPKSWKLWNRAKGYRYMCTKEHTENTHDLTLWTLAPCDARFLDVTRAQNFLIKIWTTAKHHTPMIESPKPCVLERHVFSAFYYN